MSEQWVIEREDGSQEVVIEKPRKALHGAFVRYASADRPPCINGTEDWNFKRRQWVTNEARALAWINRQHVAEHGAFAVDQARRQKATEARMILAGVEIDGIVAAEARETGQDVKELARIIAAAATETEANEVARIVARRAVRGVKPGEA